MMFCLMTFCWFLLRAGAIVLQPVRPTRALAVTSRVTAQNFNLDASCAPRVRADTVKRFRDDFMNGWAGRVANGFRTSQTPYMTISEGRTEPLFRNWIAHAEKVFASGSATVPVVNIALDAGGTDVCTDVRDNVLTKTARIALACVSLAGWLPSAFFGGKLSDNTGAGATSFGSCAYNVILWTKPHILRAAMMASQHGVLMLDTDVILHKDLIPYVQDLMQKDPRVAIVTGQEKGAGGGFWGLNSGTVYVHKDASEQILQEWVDIDGKEEWLNNDRGDQAALQQLFKDTWFKVPAYHFQLAKIPTDIIGQCGMTAEYAIHYNCYPTKMRRMMKKGDWDVLAARRTLLK